MKRLRKKNAASTTRTVGATRAAGAAGVANTTRTAGTANATGTANAASLPGAANATSATDAATPMLKKLRVKFVAANMTMIAIVLAIVLAAICVIDYQQSTNNVYSALSNSINRASDTAKRSDDNPSKQLDAADASNTADSPSAASASSAAGSPGAASASSETGASSTPNISGAASATGAPDAPNQPAISHAPGQTNAFNQTEPAPPEIGGKPKGEDSVIPVAVYLVESDGTLAVIPAMTTASIASDVLGDTSQTLAEQEDGQGFLDASGLFFAKRTVAGSTYVAFADASSASSWQTLALTLAGAGIAALAVFFIISVFFAHWALRPVEVAWQQQQQFIADASHELKTPLTVILANTAILRAHPECNIASQSQWVESTQTEAERMQELVCDMLELAKPAANTSGKSASAFERIDLSDFLEGDLLQFESVAFERKVSIEAHIDEHVFVMGSPARLHRLASTLLDNACKYANEGGTVTAALQQSARNIEFSVHNTGEPIDAKDLPHIFDRFYRADKARTSAQGSFGLGLAIAREIAEESGGTITAASSPEKGTTFTVTLPLA